MNSNTLIPPSGEASPETDFPTVGTADIAVFWDFENVRIPNWCPKPWQEYISLIAPWHDEIDHSNPEKSIRNLSLE
eukprot:scaffold2244_cov105-Skeletonema_dohrnii-CCMP3373.AAC.11